MNAVRWMIVVMGLVLGTVTAIGQEESDQPVGSVWKSEIGYLSASLGETQPLQIGLGGKAEAIIGMQWSGFVIDLPRIEGIAISKIIAGVGTYNVCAQVVYVSRNTINKGGSGRNCAGIGVGGSISANHIVWEGWRGATWQTQTFHSFNRFNENWAPVQEVSAVL